jgi:hypothetical protein
VGYEWFSGAHEKPKYAFPVIRTGWQLS